MALKDIAEYRIFHQQRVADEKLKLNKKRLRILSNIGKAAAFLKQLGASKTLLYGSILSEKRFAEKSDLDLITYGLPVSLWSAALLGLEEIEEFNDIEIDLKLAQEQSVELLAHVEEQGRILYTTASWLEN